MKPEILDEIGAREPQKPTSDNLEEKIEDFTNVSCDISIRLECDDSESVTDIEEKISILLNAFRLIGSVHVFPQDESLICLINIDRKRIDTDSYKNTNNEISEDFRNKICKRLASSLNNCLRSKIIAENYSHIQIYKGNCLYPGLKPVFQDVIFRETPLGVDSLSQLLKDIIF